MIKRYFGAGLDLAAVFAGRAGGIIATLFFVPQYQALLTPSGFGLVAIILSLQSLFLTFDLGISTIVGTEVANACDGEALMRARDDWHHGELAILLIATMTVVMAVPLSLVCGLGTLGPFEMVLVTIVIASLLLANIAQAGINALQRYRLATTIFFTATVARGSIAMLLMIFWRQDVFAFLVGQAGVSLVHATTTRFVLAHSLAVRAKTSPLFALSRASLNRLWSRSGPIIVYTLAGACALQLDKTIVARFISLELAGIYYLAAVYALTPIAVLGGPIYQYFLPKVAAARGSDVELVAARFQFLTVSAVVAPTVVLVVFADIWLDIWLPHTVHRETIRSIASLLIIGAAISATGYYPTAKLLTDRNERFLSRLGAIAAILVLSAAAAAAFFLHSVKAIAAIYVVYYCGACAILWVRVTVSLRTLMISYLVPALVLTAICVFSCLIARAVYPNLAGAVAAAAICSVETAAIAFVWWRHYGLAVYRSPEDVRCQLSR